MEKRDCLKEKVCVCVGNVDTGKNESENTKIPEDRRWEWCHGHLKIFVLFVQSCISLLSCLLLTTLNSNRIYLEN